MYADSFAAAQARMADFTFVSPSARRIFPFIGREEFFRGLETRLNNPDTVNQACTNLCGPAALMRSILMDDPELYVQYAMDLFENGVARLGSLTVKPGEDCRNVNPLADSPKDDPVQGIDWVTLASLRDSENTFWDYDDPTDAVAGITLPMTLANWMEAVGYVGVTNDTSVYFPEGEDNLDVALSLAGAGRRVCLLINADILNDPGASGGIWADHWIMLEESAGRAPALDDPWCYAGMPPEWHGAGDQPVSTRETVKLDIWTWAEKRKLPQHGRMLAQHFTASHHGHVAGQHDGRRHAQPYVPKPRPAPRPG